MSEDQIGLNSGTHQLALLHREVSGLGITSYRYNALGNRTTDFSTSNYGATHWNLHHSERDYTYDARHNLVNVRGQYNTSSVPSAPSVFHSRVGISKETAASARVLDGIDDAFRIR